jgi:hypothetical protein
MDLADGWLLSGRFLYLATNGPLYSVGPFTTFVGFDLGNVVVGGTGGWYRRGLPVPIPVKALGTAFPSVVKFAMFLT